MKHKIIPYMIISLCIMETNNLFTFTIKVENKRAEGNVAVSAQELSASDKVSSKEIGVATPGETINYTSPADTKCILGIAVAVDTGEVLESGRRGRVYTASSTSQDANGRMSCRGKNYHFIIRDDVVQNKSDEANRDLVFQSYILQSGFIPLLLP
jgi:hypothetical protein